MLDFDRLLVPVDFSRDSLAALGYALALARKLEGRQTVIALHVVDEGLPAALESSAHASQGAAEGERQQKKNAIQQLRKFVSSIDPGDESLETDVVIGRPASDEICKYAARNRIDMIVIGSQGKGALRRLVLGSTMQQVQRLAPCPVLGVKEPSALTRSE